MALDEVEFRNAFMHATSLVDKIMDSEAQAALRVVLQLVASLNDRIAELQDTEDEC